MSDSIHMCITLSEELYNEFEEDCSKNGMSKSSFICYLLSIYHDRLPMSLKYRDLISTFSSFQNDLHAIILSGALSDSDRLATFEKLKVLEEKLDEIIKNDGI